MKCFYSFSSFLVSLKWERLIFVQASSYCDTVFTTCFWKKIFLNSVPCLCKIFNLETFNCSSFSFQNTYYLKMFSPEPQKSWFFIFPFFFLFLCNSHIYHFEIINLTMCRSNLSPLYIYSLVIDDRLKKFVDHWLAEGTVKKKSLIG